MRWRSIGPKMQVRLKDQKVVKAVKQDAKARKSSNAHAVEMALEVHYDRRAGKRRVMKL